MRKYDVLKFKTKSSIGTGYGFFNFRNESEYFCIFVSRYDRTMNRPSKGDSYSFNPIYVLPKEYILAKEIEWQI